MNRPLANIRVLVVDDEDYVRGITAMTLSGLCRPEVLQARSGLEALQMLNGGAAVDIMLCDLMMPDMDGIELVRHLAEHAECPAILFASGVESAVLRAAESLARAYRIDALGSIRKPISRADLKAALDSWANRAPARITRSRMNVSASDLRNAVERNELVLHYQPKVSARTGALDSVEALVRWEHPSLGLLQPGDFLPAIEAGGLIGVATEHLVKEGFRQAAAWRAMGYDIPIALNLSPAMLSDVTIPDRFAGEADQSGVGPEAISFEITETGVARKEAILLEIITRLQMKGFRLAIDDFGTGQSSLQRLEALPFAELKIDRQFVHGIASNEPKRAIFEACIALARRFSLKTVAEGVELEQDLKMIQDSGCDTVQGFIIARPMAPAELEAWAQSSNQIKAT